MNFLIILLTSLFLFLNCQNDKSDDILLFPLIENSQITTKVRNSNSIVLANGNYTEISFDTVDYDTGGFYKFSSPDQLIIPITGTYFIVGQLEYSNNTSGVRKTNILINKNSSPYVIAADFIPASGSTSYEVESRIEALHTLEKGDAVSLQAFQDSGGNLLLLANAYSLVFTIIKLSE
ncbi:hypothetical protein [Leptospira kirschneri]|uniref:hypothetical protein n=1 Tax=Leptospira kirschneri TaxID=29507 RepID=UPI0002F56221|nr:hypothetical protein [Leptospira kirschneri]